MQTGLWIWPFTHPKPSGYRKPYMTNENLEEIALFPIPNCVVFPGMVFPLHVFEPRYRDMVQQCIKRRMPLAICHTEKVIHEVTPAESKAQALMQNQDTYKPHAIFSAGLCELVNTTDDGRLLINVFIDRRLELVEETQSLPYKIGRCRPYLDHVFTDSECEQANVIKDKIIHRLIAFSGGDPSVVSRLESPEWADKTAQAFSFEVFSIIQLEANTQQAILEDRSALSRLQRVLDVLNQR
nr:LON peptidase substrate-binding domain-containing protein [Bermanella sp. WJH001]